MNFKQLYSAIELNFDYYAERGLSLYMSRIVATSVTMPIITRDALMKAWNTAYEKQYGQDKSALWLKDIRLQHVQEKVLIASQGESTTPYDLLLDNLQSVTIDVNLPNWQDALNQAYQNMHVQKHQAQHQLIGLAQSAIQKLAPMPIVNVGIQNWQEALLASLEAETTILKARKALWPLIMSHLHCDVSGLTNSALNCINVVEERRRSNKKMDKVYAYYQEMMESLSPTSLID
jgi:hypothetical protein